MQGATENRVKLGVNVDHVATIRQARGTAYPDPLYAAMIAERAGADQITVHLREDRRHIQERDLRLMRETVTTLLNLEMAATLEMQRIAVQVKPDTITLVPERREEQTTEAGLDIRTQQEGLRAYLAPLLEAGITVSIFVDPDERQIAAGQAIGATTVEIHTGTYCDAPKGSRLRELQRVVNAATTASQMGLYVAAGHGLDYRNIESIVAIPEIQEVNIGHSIVARALIVGFEQAVKEMIAKLSRS